MKILITGAAGGIGSTLTHKLNSLNHDLILIDNLRNGYLENLIDENKKLPGKFHKICINSLEFNEIVQRELPDIIIHLAAITSLPECEVDPKECIRINVEGTVSILKSAAKFGVKRVIFSSTSAVYENTNTTEKGFFEDDTLNPTLFYSLSKKMSEEVCESFRKNYGLDVQILRFFNVFGPKQDLYRKNPPVINYIVREFYNGKVPILHSNGEQKRDYIHIDDVINLILKFTDLDKKFDEHIYNVCSNRLISLKEIVECIRKSNIEFFEKEVIFRDSNKLWENFNDLFSGVYNLKESVVEKEVNKLSLGNNSRCFTLLGYDSSNEIEKKIIETSKEIQKNIKKSVKN
jgi:UDP-glucose 4-epimerase